MLDVKKAYQAKEGLVGVYRGQVTTLANSITDYRQKLVQKSQINRIQEALNPLRAVKKLAPWPDFAAKDLDGHNNVVDCFGGAVVDRQLTWTSGREACDRLVIPSGDRDAGDGHGSSLRGRGIGLRLLGLVCICFSEYSAGLKEALAKRPHRFVRSGVAHHVAILENDSSIANGPNLICRVRHKDDGAPLILELTDALDALVLESLVTDGEDLVDHEDVRIHVDRYGKTEANVHAR